MPHIAAANGCTVNPPTDMDHADEILFAGEAGNNSTTADADHGMLGPSSSSDIAWAAESAESRVATQGNNNSLAFTLAEVNASEALMQVNSALDSQVKGVTDLKEAAEYRIASLESQVQGVSELKDAAESRIASLLSMQAHMADMLQRRDEEARRAADHAMALEARLEVAQRQLQSETEAFAAKLVGALEEQESHQVSFPVCLCVRPPPSPLALPTFSY